MSSGVDFDLWLESERLKEIKKLVESENSILKISLSLKSTTIKIKSVGDHKSWDNQKSTPKILKKPNFITPHPAIYFRDQRF